MLDDLDEKHKKIFYAAAIILLILIWPVARWVRQADTGGTSSSAAGRRIFDPRMGEAPRTPRMNAPGNTAGDGAQASPTRSPEEERAAGKAARERTARQQAYDRSLQISAAAESGIPDEQKAYERRFLRQHDKEVRSYQNYLANLGRKYMNPEVAKMDAEFASMPRFMALKDQYGKDRDAYKWARGAIALPEVRNALLHYSANPKVVGALAKAALEALSNPPPKTLYQEMLRFISTDSGMSPYVKELAGTALPRAASTLPEALPKGTDTGPLTTLGGQIAGGGGVKPPDPDPDPVSEDGCVSGATAYRNHVINAIVNFAAANPAVMTPDDGCYPPFRITAGQENAYVQGVAKLLTGWGFPARQLPWAGDVMAVKRTNAFHEEYDILTSKNCARAYGADTCRPAQF